MAEARAIVFDLDDTLYPFRSFQQSGFAAVARRVAADSGLSPARVIRALRAARRTSRGRELQGMLRALGLPAIAAPELVALIRGHAPDIELPRETVRVLAGLRRSWRVGVLTNGLPSIQRRKVAALGLDAHVDAIVFARECGHRRGKPERAPFVAVLKRLATVPARAVFVGDDLEADVFGACRVGMRTIHMQRRGDPVRTGSPVRPDASVNRLQSVPRLAERLVRRGSRAAF